MQNHSLVNQAINSWNIPTLDLKKELLDSNEDFSEKRYSILNQQHVFRTAKELAELLQLFPNYRSKDVINLVSFKPERAAYHELIVGINLKFKLSDEQQLQGLVFHLFESLKSSLTYQKIIESAYEQRAAIESICDDLIERRDVDQCHSFTQKAVLNKLQEIESLFKDKDLNFGNYVKDYTAKKALRALVCDAVYREQVIPEIKQYISDLLNQELIKIPELELCIPSCEKRLTAMIAGGQASGKSAAVQILETYLKKNDLAFDNFIKLNADNFKPLVLQPGSVNKYVYSQLAQPEANHVRILLQRQVEKMIAEHKAAHLYVDQVFLGPKKVNFSLNGKGVLAIIISTPVEAAIERSFHRGEQVNNNQGRFEHTAGVLAGHKGVAVNFFQHIFSYVGTNLNIILYDNNVAPSQVPTEVMQLDLASVPPKAVIFDIPKLKAFIKKIMINVNATNPDEVYLANHQMQTEILYRKFLQDLSEHGFTILGKPNSTLKVPSAKFADYRLSPNNRSLSLNLEDEKKRITPRSP